MERLVPRADASPGTGSKQCGKARDRKRKSQHVEKCGPINAVRDGLGRLFQHI
jgi:hypothetical protein